MQICEMRALRSLYSQRELLKLTKTRFISNPEVLCYTYTGNEHLSRCLSSSSDRRSFHFSIRRFVSESNDDSNRTWVRSGSESSVADGVGPSSGDESPNVLSIYDPVSDTLETRTVGDEEISTKVEPATSGAGTTVKRTWTSSFREKESSQRKTEVERSGDRSESSSGGESPDVLATFDPVSDTLVTKTVDDEEISTKVEPMGGAGTTVRRTWSSSFRGKESSPRKTEVEMSGDRSESSFGVESPDVLATFDPVSDTLVTRTVDDEEISTKVESTSGAGTTVRRTWSSSFRGKESSLRKTEVERSGYRPESSSSSKEFVFKKKKGKKKISWVCSNCGESSSQWWGYCRHCQASGTLKEFSELENDEDSKVRSWMQHNSVGSQPQRLTDVNKGINQLTWRVPLSGLFGVEVSRVLGGGLVPGSLVLVGGDPGVGKSTLVLQIAAMIADGGDFDEPSPVVYVSGEESAEQIGNRADRMRIGSEELFLYSSTDVEDILEKIQVLSPRALVIDSIQTVYLKEVTGSAGGLQQVKECTSALLRFSKKTNVPVFLIGHVTKTGDIAGPRVLEHIVDVVLYMEGEKYSSHRFLRSVKNRFGSTDELGVFEMSQSGLQAVSNPSEIFLSEQHFDSDVLVGLAVAVIIDGSRTFLIEIQALCVGESSTKQSNGVTNERFLMIIYVLMKQAGLKLQNNAIIVNVVSGVKLKETSGDLAIAAAICSSFLEFPIPNNVVFIGEVGLGGELRAVPNMEKRVITVSKLGYEKCIVPKTTVKSLAALDLGDIMIIGCKNLKEVINTVFQAE